jgi:hypothetical protein
MYIWMQAFCTRNRAKAHLTCPPHQSKPLDPSQWEVAMQSTTDRWCHHSKGETPDESEADTRASHVSHGPQTRPNRLQILWIPRTNLRAHLTATTWKHTTTGAHKGSADPTDRPNQPCGLQWAAATWCFLMTPWSNTTVPTPTSRSCPSTINRLGGGGKIRTHTSSPHFAFGLLPL